MRFQILYAVAAACASQPVYFQEFPLYGTATLATIGTPGQIVPVAPDFSESSIRLYHPDICPLYMDVFDPFQSSTLTGLSGVHSDLDGGLAIRGTDQVRLGESVWPEIFIRSVINLNPLDRARSAPIAGRLGLAPGSVISRSSVMELRSESLYVSGKPSRGFSVRFISSAPELGEKMSQIRTSNLMEQRWSFHGLYLANDALLRPHEILMIFDPTVAGVHMPEHDLVEIHRRYSAANGPQSIRMSGSSISVACHEDGRIMYPLDISIQLPSGEVRIAGQLLAGPPKLNRESGSQYMCETSLRSVQPQSGSEVVIGRVVLEALDSVLLDAQSNEIVFRQSAVVAPKPGKPGFTLASPATYSGARALVPTDDGVDLVLLPADPAAECKYMLESRAPKQVGPTVLLFEFTAVGTGCTRDPKLEELPGIYHVVDGIRLHEDISSRGAVLRLQRANRGDSQSYRVSIVSCQTNIIVALEPVPFTPELEAFAVEDDTGDLATLEDVNCVVCQEALVTLSDPSMSKPDESASAVDHTVSVVTACGHKYHKRCLRE